MLTKNLQSVQKWSDADLFLLLADKGKLVKDFRTESHISVKIISDDNKKRKCDFKFG